MWQKCPICEGHGLVVGGFYDVNPGVQFYTSTRSQEMCRQCNGSGLIWSEK